MCFTLYLNTSISQNLITFFLGYSVFFSWNITLSRASLLGSIKWFVPVTMKRLLGIGYEKVTRPAVFWHSCSFYLNGSQTGREETLLIWQRVCDTFEISTNSMFLSSSQCFWGKFLPKSQGSCLPQK